MALLLVVPCVLLTLLWWMFDRNSEIFNELGPPLLAMFPFIVMFLVTSVTTLRERSSGTLERLLSMPMAKLDLLVGYALAFGLVALVQALLAVGLTVGVLGLDIAGRCGRWPSLPSSTRSSAPRSGCSCRRSPRRSSRPCSSCRRWCIPQILLCGLFVAT